jgi:hypothetical protein
VRSDLEEIKRVILNWRDFYFGQPHGGRDFQEALDVWFYPWLWRLFAAGQVSAGEMVALGGWAQDQWAEVELSCRS